MAKNNETIAEQNMAKGQLGNSENILRSNGPLQDKVNFEANAKVPVAPAKTTSEAKLSMKDSNMMVFEYHQKAREAIRRAENRFRNRDSENEDM